MCADEFNLFDLHTGLAEVELEIIRAAEQHTDVLLCGNDLAVRAVDHDHAAQVAVDEERHRNLRHFIGVCFYAHDKLIEAVFLIADAENGGSAFFRIDCGNVERSFVIDDLILAAKINVIFARLLRF